MVLRRHPLSGPVQHEKMTPVLVVFDGGVVHRHEVAAVAAPAPVAIAAAAVVPAQLGQPQLFDVCFGVPAEDGPRLGWADEHYLNCLYRMVVLLGSMVFTSSTHIAV